MQPTLKSDPMPKNMKNAQMVWHIVTILASGYANMLYSVVVWTGSPDCPIAVHKEDVQHAHVCYDGEELFLLSPRQGTIIFFTLISRITPGAKLHQSARRRMLHHTCSYF